MHRENGREQPSHEVPAGVHHRFHLPVGHGSGKGAPEARAPGRGLLYRRYPARDPRFSRSRSPARAPGPGCVADGPLCGPAPVRGGCGPLALVRPTVCPGEGNPHPAEPAVTPYPGGTLPLRPEPHAGGRLHHAHRTGGAAAVLVAHGGFHPAVHQRRTSRVQAHRGAGAGAPARRSLPGLPGAHSRSSPGSDPHGCCCSSCPSFPSSRRP